MAPEYRSKSAEIAIIAAMKTVRYTNAGFVNAAVTCGDGIVLAGIAYAYASTVSATNSSDIPAMTGSLVDPSVSALVSGSGLAMPFRR